MKHKSVAASDALDCRRKSCSGIRTVAGLDGPVCGAVSRYGQEPLALADLRDKGLTAFIHGVRRERGTQLSCRTFAANAAGLHLHALAYNLGNFLRTLAAPEPIRDWSMTSLKEKLIKIGAKVENHGCFVDGRGRHLPAFVILLLIAEPPVHRPIQRQLKYSIVLSRPTDGRGASR